MVEWIDLLLLDDINRLISSTGYFFDTLDTADQSGFVVVLTTPEKDRLAKDQPHLFVDL